MCLYVASMLDPCMAYGLCAILGLSFRNLDMRMRRFGPSFGLLLRRRAGCGQLSRAPNSEVCSCVQNFFDAWHAGQPQECNMYCSRCGPCLPVGQATGEDCFILQRGNVRLRFARIGQTDRCRGCILGLEPTDYQSCQESCSRVAN